MRASLAASVQRTPAPEIICRQEDLLTLLCRLTRSRRAKVVVVVVVVVVIIINIVIFLFFSYLHNLGTKYLFCDANVSQPYL